MTRVIAAQLIGTHRRQPVVGVRSLIMTLLCLGVVGCQDTGRQETQPTAATVAATTIATPTGPRDSPPEGVLGHTEWYEGGDPGIEEIACRQAPRGLVPAVSLEPPGTTVEVAQYTFACFSGFILERPITAILWRPDGTRRRVPVDAGDDQAAVLDFTSEDPIGSYKLIAAQANRRAELTFQVRPAQKPSVFVRNVNYRRHTAVPIVLSGFQPHERVQLLLYEREGGAERWRYRHRASMPVQTDDRGQATYRLDARSLRPHPYAVAVHPATSEDVLRNTFWIGD